MVMINFRICRNYQLPYSSENICLITITACDTLHTNILPEL